MKLKGTNAGSRALALIGLMLALAGCSGDHRELQAYIDEVKARPGRPIEPLPEVRPAPSFAYEPGDRRSPFVPDQPLRAAASGPGAISGPDPDRPREHLESETLDSLTMVGTLRNARGNFGLVQDADGLVHRVTIGNYMGQNHGRITNITESTIELIEIVPDGLGGYTNRPRNIGLSD